MSHGNDVWCKHYTGLCNATCAAGVAYADVGLGPGPPTRQLAVLPCFQENTSPKVACGKCAFPTAEELAAEEAEDRKRMEDMGTARKAIVAHLGGPWKRGTPTANGAIDCPVCGGQRTLRFSRAGYNGHVHAACGTEGCVRWME